MGVKETDINVWIHMVSATDDIKKRNGKRHIHMHTAHTRAE